MEMAEITGFLAAAFTAFCNVPQLIRILRRDQTKDLSLWMYLALTIGLSLWVAYGVMTGSWPVMIANAFSLVTVMPILGFIVWKRFIG